MGRGGKPESTLNQKLEAASADVMGLWQQNRHACDLANRISAPPGSSYKSSPVLHIHTVQDILYLHSKAPAARRISSPAHVESDPKPEDSRADLRRLLGATATVGEGKRSTVLYIEYGAGGGGPEDMSHANRIGFSEHVETTALGTHLALLECHARESLQYQSDIV